MAVALMHRMHESRDVAADAQAFAYALQDSWGVGDPACDNGVLILFTALEGQLVLAPGAAVEALLPAAALAGALKDVRVEVQEARYGAAMELAVTRIGLALADAARPHDGPSPAGGDHHFHWGLLLEELLVAFGCVSAAVGAVYQRHRRRARAKRQYEDCRSGLEGIRQDHLAAIQGQGGGAGSCCPLCLAPLDHSCTTSGPHFALHVGRRISASDDGAASCSDTEAGSCSDTEASLRQPLNPAGAAAGAGAAAAASPVRAWQRPGVLFPCGHAFCEPCIAARFNHQITTCPVCSHAADEDAAAAATTGAPHTAASATDVAAAAADASTSTAAAPVTAPAVLCGSGSGGAAAAGIPALGAQLLSRLRERWEARLRGGAGPLGPAGSEVVQFPALIFRLRQLQRQYPQLLSLEMTTVWEQDLREGRDLDAQQMRTFKSRDPTARQEGLMGAWRLVRRHTARLQGLRLWRARR